MRLSISLPMSRRAGTSFLEPVVCARFESAGGSGWRGGARVVYFFHHPLMPIYLLALYAKNEKGDLSARDKKEFAEFAEFTKEVVRQWQKK
jgi:hypothetical protein